MLEAYEEYHDAARGDAAGSDGARRAPRGLEGFTERGYQLGHVTGHSIGMTMIEHPKIGEGVEIELAEGMVFSMHPHAIAANGRDCLYMQDTWLVTEAAASRSRACRCGSTSRVTEGSSLGPDGVARCLWGASTDEYRAYHDAEWGFPVDDDRRLFEKLCLEGFQSGLSWLTILRKREAFRRAFAGFDFEAVARFGERDVERLLGDASIVRHRGKIESTINNARRAVELVEAEGSLAAYVWRFEPRRARSAVRPCARWRPPESTRWRRI